jgi:hypothetical protein
MTTSGALIAPATSSSTSRGSSAGQSPGHEQDALVVALEGPVDAGARRVRVAAVVVGDRLGVVGAGQRLGAVLAGDDDDLVDPLGRGAARAARR